ncbi:cytochrome ubiquinol oxidase subunit I [Alteromonas macleodii]|uniref:Cytochrome d ubiquinol oxidase subunit 1 n=1 Tax=Alteromonas macleodii TaxID=28108 RepID=A0AB36FNH4_ALTMA|nr:cytochrome ubiquinol oxidase subunit I [Alteromonas macleodii]OES26128.1 cytochrome d ubiquinol oxidase subunit 1 [Alteromonas macleodii]OES26752.1 cytochrome d ubiquinol oxidase subunit 1 [Alteromonas macleodii]OES27283.1 cytochrome d ubiquinol oxidase subunit 1 [Alteromonas macleodii]OES39538.1 cytochrome d ubiquinol oxidase subunit 1 [Alteromonas macleodii]OZB97072.1 cytochrome d terminal oxidase subunit 1 [Alteromonas macleodii]
MSDTLIELSRWQFALTAMFHFIFVPLTLGLSFLLAIMESVYVMTGKEIYKQMTQFWGKLFGINFAIGVATGLTMEFQFGMNWSYYSHYVGDIFGAPLAIEGLMAFFLESTFVGLFFFGWDKMSKVKHLMATWLVAIGSNFSALWILIANGWMQYPVGAEFNFEAMRMEMTSFAEVIFNPVAQVKFVHTVSAGYVTGAMFVLAISSYYLLNHKHIAFARRSFAIAASFGLASTLSVIVLGDESGYELGDVQKVKLAAVEAEYETHPAPAPFTVFGIPNDEKQETEYALQIPWAMGIIATRSLTEEVKGIKDLKEENRERILSGIKAYEVLDDVRNGTATAEQRAAFDANKDSLGYAMLLEPFTENVSNPSDAALQQAVDYSIPPVAPLFWSFRLMVAAGFIMLALFVCAFYYSTKHKITKPRWLLKSALYGLPLPWIACEAGWFVAEYGRQPWSIAEVLPVHTSVSNLAVSDVVITLVAYSAFYTGMFIIGFYLMKKFAKKGPIPPADKQPDTEFDLIDLDEQGAKA